MVIWNLLLFLRCINFQWQGKNQMQLGMKPKEVVGPSLSGAYIWHYMLCTKIMALLLKPNISRPPNFVIFKSFQIPYLNIV